MERGERNHRLNRHKYWYLVYVYDISSSKYRLNVCVYTGTQDNKNEAQKWNKTPQIVKEDEINGKRGGADLKGTQRPEHVHISPRG